LAQNGETQTYRSTSLPANVDFLVGAATALTPVAIIAPDTTCAKCHVDVLAHGGGRRGVDTCLLCHGSAGTEDRPQYVAAAAPATAPAPPGRAPRIAATRRRPSRRHNPGAWPAAAATTPAPRSLTSTS